MSYNYTKDTGTAAYAPVRYGFDVTPSPTPLSTYTTAIMVNTEGATVTGILAYSKKEFTTLPLSIGVMYPFSFEKITAVSAGNVKAYSAANERIKE